MTTTLPSVLDEIDDYLDARADSEDGSYGIPEANEAMRLLTALRAAQVESERRWSDFRAAAEQVNEIARAYHDADDVVTYETVDAIAQLDAALAKAERLP